MVSSSVCVTGFRAWKLLNLQQGLDIREGLGGILIFLFSDKPLFGLCRLAGGQGSARRDKNTEKRGALLKHKHSSQPFPQPHL